MENRCIFCEERIVDRHHQIPKEIQEILGKDERVCPLCPTCHRKLGLVDKPLINKIKRLPQMQTKEKFKYARLGFGVGVFVSALIHPAVGVIFFIILLFAVSRKR